MKFKEFMSVKGLDVNECRHDDYFDSNGAPVCPIGHALKLRDPECTEAKDLQDKYGIEVVVEEAFFGHWDKNFDTTKDKSLLFEECLNRAEAAEEELIAYQAEFEESQKDVVESHMTNKLCKSCDSPTHLLCSTCGESVCFRCISNTNDCPDCDVGIEVETETEEENVPGQDPTTE